MVEFGVPIPVKKGARTVKINKRDAARIGDPMMCKAKIVSGSSNVIIGDSPPRGQRAAFVKRLPRKARKVPPAVEAADEIVLDAGGKGAWNKTLNTGLTPNTAYRVRGYLYRTDHEGRVVHVSGDLDLTKAERNTYQQRKAGKLGEDGDEGGHMIASIFNGPGEMVNLFPQNGNFNKGVWKSMETRWADALKEVPPKTVKVEIELKYADDGVRPNKLVVYETIGDDPQRKTKFKNSPGGE